MPDSTYDDLDTIARAHVSLWVFQASNVRGWLRQHMQRTHQLHAVRARVAAMLLAPMDACVVCGHPGAPLCWHCDARVSFVVRHAVAHAYPRVKFYQRLDIPWHSCVLLVVRVVQAHHARVLQAHRERNRARMPL